MLCFCRRALATGGVAYWWGDGLTGGVMAAVLWFGNMVMPWAVTVIVAIVVRLLLTGALHEDGLADFFDGFGGGGSDRQRILDIMKDSHIGTYGVLGLILYMLLLWGCLSSLTPWMAALAVFAADPYAKMVTSQLVVMMPYARREEEAKAKVVYRKISALSGVSLARCISSICLSGASYTATLATAVELSVCLLNSPSTLHSL